MRAPFGTIRELGGRLRSVLQHAGAAEAVYIDFVYPVYLATGGVPAVEDMLTRGRQGRMMLAGDAKAKAESLVHRLQPMVATVARLTDVAVHDAARIVDQNALSHAFKEALGDRLTTSIVAAVRLRRNRAMTAAQLRDAVTRQINEKLSPTGNGLVLAKGLSRNQTQGNLNVLYRLRAIAAGNAGRLRARLANLDTQDGLDRDFKAVMSSDLAAAKLISEEALRPVPEVFRRSSILGSALTRGGGRWSINPYRKREVELAVAYLEQRLRDYDEHHKALRSAAGTLQADAAGDRLAELAVLQMAVNDVLRDVDGLAGRWIDAYFEHAGRGYRVRAGKAGEIADIAKAAPEISPSLTIDTAPARYSNTHTVLLRSSTYLFLRSRFARDVYFHEFRNHYAARLWGIFDWSAQQANDPEEFRRALQAQQPLLRQVAATHQKVIIYVFHTPKWLSDSRDRRDVDGRPAYLLHSPKDYAAWQRYVRDAVRFLKESLAGTEVYYEVWNEPDIYWLEGNDAYLRLYAETVAAIKQEDPAAKVGGAAMNGWDAKAKGEHGGGPLNLALIDYARSNGVPLDFISWHVFERPLSDLEAAKQAYLAEIRKLGMKSVPEFVISEWSIPGRGSRYEAVAFAEYMLGLYRLGESIQTVAVWEEFSRQPRPQQPFAPWGMLTDQGYKKPMFHVHRYFDRLSRDSTGIAVFQSRDQRTKVVTSRKRDGSYELVLWETRYSRPLEAALKVLQQSGLDATDLKGYGTIEALQTAIRTGKARNPEHAAAFRSAAEIYRSTPSGAETVALHFAGAKRLRVTANEAVGIRPAGGAVFTSGGDLVANLPREGVMWLRVEVD